MRLLNSRPGLISRVNSKPFRRRTVYESEWRLCLDRLCRHKCFHVRKYPIARPKSVRTTKLSNSKRDEHYRRLSDLRDTWLDPSRASIEYIDLSERANSERAISAKADWVVTWTRESDQINIVTRNQLLQIVSTFWDIARAR